MGIKSLYEEVRDPVKNADKIKSLKEKYDKIMKKLDEEERKQENEQSRQAAMMIVGKQFTPTPRPILSAIDVGSSSTPNSNDTATSSAISTLVNRPFSTPHGPKYSTENSDPGTLRSKSEITPQEKVYYGTPLHIQFDKKGESSPPGTSPPPPHHTTNTENQNPQILSPDSQRVKRMLNFDPDPDPDGVK